MSFLLRRLAVLCCAVLALVGFHLAPEALGLGEAGNTTFAILAATAGPLAAAACCGLAAWRSSGGERTAWTSFAIGSALYLSGNLCYIYFAVAGVAVTFPTVPEAAFFVMALFFAVGMFQYGKVRERISRVQVYNFILIYCSVTLATLFMLHRGIADSVMPPFATMVAFAYPALWFSVAAFGLLSVLLYEQRGKVFPFVLLVVAMFAEAIADYGYALSLMNGTYRAGGLTQALWIASAGLIVWSAIAHMGRTGRPGQRRVTVRGARYRRIAQASIPGAALGIILVTGSISGELGSGPYLGLGIGLAVAFALVSAFREHWIIGVQRQLRRAVELSRADLAKSEERLTAVLESTSDSVLVLDHDWHVVYFNRQAVKTINGKDRLRLGISLWELFPAALTSGEGAHYREVLATRQPAEFEIFVENRGVWLGIHAYPTEGGLSIFFRDISERRRIREEITHLAHHDPLTGLANRAVFQQQLQQAVEAGTRAAILLLDLDHFKDVNDTMGHPVGDAMLVETAARLRQCVLAGDTVARLGGDEFAILLVAQPGTAEVRRLAQRVVEAAGAAHSIEGQLVRLGASVGIAISAGKDDAGQMFRNADMALYAAKSEARGTYRIFEPAMERDLQQRRALRADLAVALDNGELDLAFQPIVDLRSERVCSFEALLRWRHPVRGDVAPDVFIPIAEESGLIVPIGEWVLRTACAEAAKWPADISVAVNLSTRQFGSSDLADKITQALTASGLSHDRLELEITESVLLEDSKANMGTLRRLQELGIRIALDDFGTGFSSLGYLQRFPFSKIKIDRSFISGLPANDESQAIVRSVIGLGQSLHMRVTAEGVESRAQFDWVKAGCDEAQGYFLSRPVPAAQIPELLARLGADGADRKTEETRLAS